MESSHNGGDQNALVAPARYPAGGRIMLTAMVALVALVLAIVLLHIYARWYFLHRISDLPRRRRRRVETLDFAETPFTPPTLAKGLNPAVLKAIPATKFAGGEIECAVCLIEAAEGEMVRILPKCGHGFHEDCIDMWFESHSTCPLCRATVEAVGPEAEGKPPAGRMAALRRLLTGDLRGLRGGVAAETDLEQGEGAARQRSWGFDIRAGDDGVAWM